MSIDTLSQSQTLRNLELMIEYKNLISSLNCPSGCYVMPTDDLHNWHGVMFIHRGYYKEAVFKFNLLIPNTYPESPPVVKFVSQVFHPLVDSNGILSLGALDSHWRPRQDYICHVLHYIKDIFKDSSIKSLKEAYCPHAEALQMYQNERSTFIKLASDCAQISSQQSILFEQDQSIINFKPLDDGEFVNIRLQLHKSVGL
ncbi:ubiquitin-conjugating enzyme/RWD-like protein [Globomyces pollinis-pini]|nr:ubiquitin-conjugating enzyme/RWD-like protein [Globomyces pollinis-pini]